MWEIRENECDWSVVDRLQLIQLKRRWHGSSQEKKVDTKMCVWKEIKKEIGVSRQGWRDSEKVEV